MSSNKVSNSELFGDSSSDDNDDDDDEQANDSNKEEAKEAATKKAAATPAVAANAPPRRPTLQDSDDDEDEDEFDDRGVVGLPSSTIAGDKLPSANKTGDDDGDHDGAGGAFNLPGATDNRKDAYNLTVQKTPHPNANTSLYFTRLPNLIGIQPEAFDPDTYTPEAEQDEYSVHDMVRWRYKMDNAGHIVRDATAGGDADAKLQRESNTRLVQWEDDSWTLHIGNEAFEIDIVNSAANGFAGLNGYLYLSQQATKVAVGENENDDDNDSNNAATEQPAGTVLECMGPVASRFVARPSLHSQAHKSMTVAIRQKTIKKARIEEFVTELDPEKLKQERIQVKAELEKVEARKRAGYGGYAGGRRAGGGGGSRPRMNRDYLEDDDDFDTTNIKSLKRGEFEEMDDYGEDSDESEEETFHKARPTRKGRDEAARKKKEESSSGEDIQMDDDDDDDEEEVAPKAKSSKKRSVQAVIDDDSDSD